MAKTTRRSKQPPADDVEHEAAEPADAAEDGDEAAEAEGSDEGSSEREGGAPATFRVNACVSPPQYTLNAIAVSTAEVAICSAVSFCSYRLNAAPSAKSAPEPTAKYFSKGVTLMSEAT